MALTPSAMTALGTRAPDFTLLNTVTDSMDSLEQLKGEQATVIMFICNHCPFVVHVQEELVKLANDYLPGIKCIAISANDVSTHPQDGPQHMRQLAKEHSYSFPYLYDETQEVAKAYDATCTPDFFVYDKDLLLVYRGQLDDSRPGNGTPVTGKDLRAALDAILAGEQVSQDQKPSIGCNIKWK